MKFKIKESCQGYIRGTHTIIVEANSKKEAVKHKNYGKVIKEEHDRDDTENEIQSVERYKDGQACACVIIDCCKHAKEPGV